MLYAGIIICIYGVRIIPTTQILKNIAGIVTYQHTIT